MNGRHRWGARRGKLGRVCSVSPIFADDGGEVGLVEVEVSRDDFGGHGLTGAGSAGKQDLQAALDSARLS
jgi:hypothetical protein